MKKPIIFFLIILALAGITYFLWKHNKSEKTVQPPPPQLDVITYKVVPSKLTIDLYAIGTLQAFESSVISTEIAGKVDQIPLQEGQPVKKGDLLLQIDDAEYKQKVERSKADFNLAELTSKRDIDLLQSGAVTAQKRDESAASLMVKKSEYESAKIDLERTKIVAPFDGFLGISSVGVGEYLAVGAKIVTLSTLNPIIVQFLIPQNYLSKINQDDPISLTVDAWPEKTFEGKITVIDPQLDAETRRITIKASIPNPDHLLHPGMFASVTLNIGSTDDALLIPEEALIPSADQTTVFKVIDNIAQITKVTVGVRQNNLAEITEGLQPNDIIISAGQLKVRDGMKVQPIPPPTHKNNL